MKTLPLSDVKSRLSEIAEEVHLTHDRVTVTKNGKEHVVLIAAEDLSSMEATLELLADPEAMARIQQAEREIARGESISLDDIIAGRA